MKRTFGLLLAILSLSSLLLGCVVHRHHRRHRRPTKVVVVKSNPRKKVVVVHTRPRHVHGIGCGHYYYHGAWHNLPHAQGCKRPHNTKVVVFYGPGPGRFYWHGAWHRRPHPRNCRHAWHLHRHGPRCGHHFYKGKWYIRVWWK